MMRHRKPIPEDTQATVKRGMLQRVGKALELPETIVQNGPHIEINGNGEMVVDGCKGILDYDTDAVKISVGRYAVTVLGEKLEIKHFSEGTCTVAGVIKNIGFGV